MKVAFVVPYPLGKAPSQRFRFEQQLSFFSKEKINYRFFPFLTEKAFDNLYQPGHFFSKAITIIASFIGRFFLMFTLKKFDLVFIHREASPIGPPIFEWIIAKVLKKQIVYDFDDAIWLQNTSDANKIVARIKWHHKVESICKWANKISCGNEYLAEFARQFNTNVYIVPTTVDMEFSHNKTKNQDTNSIVVGWTGTHSTIKYLYDLEPLLVEIQKNKEFIFQVISNKDPKFENLKYKYISWSKASEIDDLLMLNIGIMPLKDDQWAKGKCGFKAIQYMSLGIPAIVSNVGVNATIVNNKVNGFVCNNVKEWKESLSILIENENLRFEFGKKAKQKIQDNYSKKAVRQKYMSLFNFSI